MIPAQAVWTTPPGRLFLHPGDVHLWLVSEEAPPGSLESILPPEELQRSLRMIRPADQRRYLSVRGALRGILGSYLRVSPPTISIAYSESGKPFLENQPDSRHALHFNVSHAGGLAVVVVSRGLRVGIDIERVREIEAASDILNDFFSAAEQAWVQSLPDERKTQEFFRLWTRREAASKAVGTGLLRSFSLFSMPARPLCPSGFCLALPKSARETAAQDWWMRDLSPAPGHAGALCVENQNSEPSFWRFSW